MITVKIDGKKCTCETECECSKEKDKKKEKNKAKRYSSRKMTFKAM